MNFSRRKTKLWGETYDLLWPDVDTECHSAIADDLNDFHKKHLDEYVKSRRTCVQAGGNCGMYPLAYSTVFERVFTFEPDEDNFRCLVDNCHEPRIHKFEAALGENPGLMHIDRQWPHNVGMHKISSEGDAIQVLSLDDLMLENVDLIHLDIEGYEYYALQGAIVTIHKWQPALFLEISKMRGEIETFLDGIGYKHVAGVNADHVFIPR